MGPPYTNETLANDYFDLIGKHRQDISIFPVWNSIVGAPINLAEHYHAHGSIADVRIPHAGPRTKSNLELILQYGLREAKLQYDLRKHKQLKRFSGHPPRHFDSRDNDPSFDNAIRRVERD